MTDPTPLLSPEPEQPPPLLHQKHQPPSLDHVIEHCVGNPCWTQLLQAILVSVAWFFDAQQTFITVFTDADPKWTCINSTLCTPSSNICHLPPDIWTWDLPPTTSTISEWSLQCSGSIITGLPSSSFFLGCLIGGFSLSTLGDSSLGRKNLLVLASLIMSLSGVATALSKDVWMYSALRFISGFGRATIGTCALVLSTELVSKKWREIIGILGFVFFTMGFVSLPCVAFFLKGSSWRLIYLWTSIPSVLYSCLLYFSVRESPRWLFVKGRKEEFAETLRSFVAPTVRSSITQSFFNRCTEKWEENYKQVEETSDIFSAMRVLLKKGWAFRRLAAVMVVGFGVGMIYYGMPLGLGNLSFDLYLSVTLNALSEFPASLLTFFLIGKFDRKRSVLGLAVVSGACSGACVVVTWKVMQMGMELLSFFCACTAFDIVLIYTLELFPTCVRNSAVSLVRQALVFGAVLSPVLVAAGRTKGLVLSYGVFGVTILVCGLFVGCLPETRGRTLCDTMEEEERMVRAAGDGVYCV